MRNNGTGSDIRHKVSVPDTLTAMVTSALLRSIEFFDGFDDDALTTLAANCASTTHHRGDSLFVEGDAASELYIVVSGRIAISTRAADGRRHYR